MKNCIYSGANVSIISDITHINTNTNPLCRRAEDVAGMLTGSDMPMKITGSGSFAGVDGKICTDSNYSLLPVSQWNKSNNCVTIFDEFGACGVINSGCCEGAPLIN